MREACLGVNIDEHLTWLKHIDSIRLKVTRHLWVLKKVRDFLNVNCLLSLYNAIIEPYFLYCSIVWDYISDSLESKLQKWQNRSARIITKSSYLKSSSLILFELGWQTIKEMRNKHKAILMYKIMTGLAPSYLSEMFTFSSVAYLGGGLNTLLNATKYATESPKTFFDEIHC